MSVTRQKLLNVAVAARSLHIVPKAAKFLTGLVTRENAKPEARLSDMLTSYELRAA